MDDIDAVDQETLDLLESLHPGAGSNLLERVVATYIDEASRQFGRMRAAVEASDTLALRKAAHALKSSSGSVGAVPLAGLCARIERADAAAAPADARALLQAAGRECDRVREALLARLAGGCRGVRI